MKKLYLVALGLALSFSGSAYAIELDNTVLYGLHASTQSSVVSGVTTKSDAAAGLVQYLFWEDSSLMAKNAATFYKDSTVIEVNVLWNFVNYGQVKVGVGGGVYLEQGKGVTPTSNSSGFKSIVGAVYAVPDSYIAITVDYSQRLVGLPGGVSEHAQSAIGVVKEF